MGRSRKPRAFPATRGNWSAGSMAWSAPAPSPTNRSRPILNGKPLRLFVIGFEPGRPGGPRKLVGRARDLAQPLRNDRRPLCRARARPGSAAGHARPQIHRGRPDAQRGHLVRRSGRLHHLARRPNAAVRAPLRRRRGAKPRAAAAWQTNDQINAVIAKVSPYVPVNEVAAALSRWKHLTALTQDQQETLLSKFVIELARKQQMS